MQNIKHLVIAVFLVGCDQEPTLTSTVRLANDVEIQCSRTGDRAECSVKIEDRAVSEDPLDGQMYVGKYCVGCNDGGHEDEENTGFYIMCFACAGDRCCGATCTENGGWHCGSDGCS